MKDLPPEPQLGSKALYGPLGRCAEVVAASTEVSPTAVILACLVLAGSYFPRTYIERGAARHYPRLSMMRVPAFWPFDSGSFLGPLCRLFDKVNLLVGPELASDIVRGPLTPRSGRLAGRCMSNRRPVVLLDNLSPGWWRRRSDDLASTICDTFDGFDLPAWSDPTRSVPPPTAFIGQVRAAVIEEVSVEAAQVAARCIWWDHSRDDHRYTVQPLAVDDLNAVATQIAESVLRQRARRQVHLDDSAELAWEQALPNIVAQGAQDIVDACKDHAAAQVLRMALIFSLLDSTAQVQAAHVEAALATWGEHFDSVMRLFGDTLPCNLPDTIRGILIQAQAPLTTSELHAAFNNHLPARRLKAALEELVAEGRVVREHIPTFGRPREVYRVRTDDHA